MAAAAPRRRESGGGGRAPLAIPPPPPRAEGCATDGCPYARASPGAGGAHCCGQCRCFGARHHCAACARRAAAPGGSSELRSPCGAEEHSQLDGSFALFGACAGCAAETERRGCRRCRARLCPACFAAHRAQGPAPRRTDYEDLRELRRDATTRVALSRRRRDGVLFALKCVEKADHIAFTAQEREAMVALQRARTPHVVETHACFQTQSHLFVVHDYMPGGDLAQYLRRTGPMPEPAARRAMAQVLEGLSALHREGIVHRDVKPENILLDARGNCLLGEFRLAREDGHCQTSAGPDYYTAPEMLTSTKVKQTFLSDWWAYGCVIVNALTNDNPFQGATSMQVYGAILRNPPQLGRVERSRGAELVLRLLTKDPQHRADGRAARDHPWFRGVEWPLLAAGAMPGWDPPDAPPVPPVRRSPPAAPDAPLRAPPPPPDVTPAKAPVPAQAQPHDGNGYLRHADRLRDADGHGYSWMAHPADAGESDLLMAASPSGHHHDDPALTPSNEDAQASVSCMRSLTQ